MSQQVNEIKADRSFVKVSKVFNKQASWEGAPRLLACHCRAPQGCWPVTDGVGQVGAVGWTACASAAMHCHRCV